MILVIGVLVGVLIGVFSGLIGVGGGILLVPILLYFFGMNQHQAQGTSLAMLLPPSGLLAFWQYYKAGNADLKLGLLIAAGVFIGGYIGAEYAQQIPQTLMRRIFALVLAGTAIKMFLQK